MPQSSFISESVKVKVRRACLKNKLAADDDKVLLAEVWKASGWSNRRTLLQNLRIVPSPESVRRARQLLVQEGLIEPSVSATERRYNNFKRVRKDLGYGR